MNILYIATEPIYPADTGARIRSYQLVKALATKHRVEVAYISAEPMAAEVDAPYATAHYIRLPHSMSALSSRQKATFLLKAATQRSFPLFDFYQGDEQMEQVMKVLSSGEFELVMIQSSYLLPLAKTIRKVYPELPLILDAHNIEWVLQERMAATSKTAPLRWIKRQMAFNLRRWEMLADRSVDGIAAVSGQEADWWQEHCPAAVVMVIPNGVDVDYFRPTVTLPEEPVISFCGSMSYRPNDEGAQWFLAAVWPRLQEKVPGIRWLIIGKDPSDEVRAMADNHITVTGRVDDVRAWLEQSRLSVVPLLAGGGTRLKILEAMAMERVVVSTRLGAEGIAAGEGLVLADTPEDMADRVAELLEDEQLSKLGKANRKRAIAEFSWKSIGQQMLQLVDKVME